MKNINSRTFLNPNSDKTKVLRYLTTCPQCSAVILALKSATNILAGLDWIEEAWGFFWCWKRVESLILTKVTKLKKVFDFVLDILEDCLVYVSKAYAAN